MYAQVARPVIATATISERTVNRGLRIASWLLDRKVLAGLGPHPSILQAKMNPEQDGNTTSGY
jgi:formamidopyrimidine-DNA glycosylase